MNLKYILSTVGSILKYFAALLLAPVICAIVLKEYCSAIPFLGVAFISYLLSFLLAGKKKELENFNNINRGETLAVVLITWA